jgi:hypothetical protein
VNEKEAAYAELENIDKLKTENKMPVKDNRVKRKNFIHYLYVITTEVDAPRLSNIVGFV